MQSQPLHFGIIVNERFIYKWQYESIQKIVSSNIGHLDIIIDVSSPPETHDFTTFKLLSNHHQIVKKIKKMPLYAFFKLPFNNRDSISIVSLEGKWADVKYTHCPLIKLHKNFSKEFSEYINEQSLDFILDFSSLKPEYNLFFQTKWGVWSFSYSRKFQSDFWDIKYGDCIAEVTLLKSTPDSIVILRQGYFKIKNPTSLYGFVELYHECARWPYEICKKIIDYGNTFLNHCLPGTTNMEALEQTKSSLYKFIFNNALNAIKCTSKKFRFSKWNIGIINSPITELINHEDNYDIKWLKSSPNRGDFKADPFGISLNGKYYIFYEDFNFRSQKGVISSAIFTKKSDIIDFESVSIPCLQLPTHISYPCLFSYENDLYMIPETSLMKEIALYKAIKFPSEWRKEKVLIEDFHGVDNTIIHYRDYWWLFSTPKEAENLKLYIWYAHDLYDKWIPHPRNPVKIDARSTRPGGTPFIIRENLYRPAQNSLETYGGQLVINQIIELTPQRFEEKVVFKFSGFDHYKDGCHTLSSCDNLTLIDAKTLEFDLLLSLKYINRYILKKLPTRGNKGRKGN